MVSGISRSNTPAGWFCQQDCRIFINIDAGKKKKKGMQAKSQLPPCLYETDLCEYYVNWKQTHLIPFLVRQVLMTVFETESYMG